MNSILSEKSHPPARVPLLDLPSENRDLEAELKEVFARVLRSGQFILGPDVEKFEREIAVQAGAKHAIAVSSGTDAILLALMALGIGPGDEVICPSFTFFATAGCVHRTGATPVFADSCPGCFNLSPASLRSKITQKTKAIIPVHLYGQAAAMDSIMEIASKQEIPVIEDAAQAMGADFQGRPVGSIGTFGVYSFFPSKNLGGFGDGGMLVCNNDELAEKARILRTHGAQPKYFHRYVGANFRMDTLQAALLRVKLPRLEEYNDRRRRNASYYHQNLAGLFPGGDSPEDGCLCERNDLSEGGEEIEDGPAILLPRTQSGRGHIWNQYTIRARGGRRDSLRSFLDREGISSEVYYPLPLHLQECFKRPGHAAESLPCAEMLAREVLSLPIYPELEESQLDQVLEAIQRFSGGTGGG